MKMRYLAAMGDRQLLGGHVILENDANSAHFTKGGGYLSIGGSRIGMKRHGKLWIARISIHQSGRDLRTIETAAPMHEEALSVPKVTVHKRRSKFTLQTWHAIFGHPSKKQTIRTLAASIGGAMTNAKFDETCVTCATGKARRAKRPHEARDDPNTEAGLKILGIKPGSPDDPNKILVKLQKEFRKCNAQAKRQIKPRDIHGFSRWQRNAKYQIP